uniref:Uncharacterized protein n=1 Tax=Rhizophora mucronata TaxID=61149 RepID=A0A2P2IH79_RHIMU
MCELSMLHIFEVMSNFLLPQTHSLNPFLRHEKKKRKTKKTIFGCIYVI